MGRLGGAKVPVGGKPSLNLSQQDANLVDPRVKDKGQTTLSNLGNLRTQTRGKVTNLNGQAMNLYKGVNSEEQHLRPVLNRETSVRNHNNH